MPPLIDLTGQQFGRLKVIEQAGKDKWGASKWLCKCDCGKKMIVLGCSLRSGHTKSCGCFKKEGNNNKHGHSKRGKPTREYNSWQTMIQRCINPNNKNYQYYGEIGIKVCKRWMGENGFIIFFEDMGKRPLGCTLERKDNDKGYYKKNCEWATSKKQARNKRNSCYVTYRGKRWLFIELCEEHNMPYGIVYERYYGLSWTLEDALTTPVGKQRRKKK